MGAALEVQTIAWTSTECGNAPVEEDAPTDGVEYAVEDAVDVVVGIKQREVTGKNRGT